MGLLLGASVLTVFELLDLLIYNTFRKLSSAGERRDGSKSNGHMSQIETKIWKKDKSKRTSSHLNPKILIQ